MNHTEVPALARKHGARVIEYMPEQLGGTITFDVQILAAQLSALIAEVEARTLERAAVRFDERAVLPDGGISPGWYEPQEPAEIIRSLKPGQGADSQGGGT